MKALDISSILLDAVLRLTIIAYMLIGVYWLQTDVPITNEYLFSGIALALSRAIVLPVKWKVSA